MISFSCVNTIPGIPASWWGLLGREISRTLRYRRPRVVGVQSLSLKDMQQVNKRYRAKDRPTDVLSFASEVQGRGEVWEMGDILLCPDYARHEAERRGVPFSEEMVRLVIHGCLHLSGLDHATKQEEEHMFGLQERCLERFFLCLNRL